MTDTPNPSPPSDSRLLNAIGGASLGGFIALLLGLSSAPVVASTLTVLLGAATIFLALQDQLPSGTPREMNEALLYRIIGFSIAGIAGLLIGLFLRATDAFGVSPEVRLYQDLQEVGVPDEAARELVLSRLTGAEAGSESDADRNRRSTTLFSTGASAPNCIDLDPANFANIDSILARYDAERGAWMQIAETVRVAMAEDPDTDGLALAGALHAVHCARAE